ncbi:MAG: lipoprotein [Zoogloeaceae bacterium]|nr:lipoprotein [Zoogloeaceae bacterium]
MMKHSFFLIASLAAAALLSACGVKGSLEVPAGPATPTVLDRLLPHEPATKSAGPDANTADPALHAPESE